MKTILKGGELIMGYNHLEGLVPKDAQHMIPELVASAGPDAEHPIYEFGDPKETVAGLRQLAVPDTAIERAASVHIEVLFPAPVGKQAHPRAEGYRASVRRAIEDSRVRTG